MFTHDGRCWFWVGSNRSLCSQNVGRGFCWFTIIAKWMLHYISFIIQLIDNLEMGLEAIRMLWCASREAFPRSRRAPPPPPPPHRACVHFPTIGWFCLCRVRQVRSSADVKRYCLHPLTGLFCSDFIRLCAPEHLCNSISLIYCNSTDQWRERAEEQKLRPMR